MRLGLLADIHEAVENLAAAIDELRKRKVDSFVMLGDVLDQGVRADETVALLAGLPGHGVWGNHDFGLCGIVHPSVQSRFSASTLEYFARLQPWVELEGSRFQHIDAHLDPASFEDLWRFPSIEERIAGFAQFRHAKVFVGHWHRWEVLRPEGPIAWDGERPIQYRTDVRYLTVVNSVVGGWCAIYDSERHELEPIRLLGSGVGAPERNS